MGLDVARGVAIIGMVGAHVGGVPQFDWVEPVTWFGLVHGRSSLLFAMLAGVSIALMTGRSRRPAPEQLPYLRLSLIGRGMAIFVIGVLLELLHTPAAIILTMYGVLYAIAILFLRWSPRRLLITATLIGVLGPPVLAAFNALTLMPFGPGLSMTVNGMYPITVWVAMMLVGMAIGQMPLQRTRTAVWIVVTGVAVAFIGYALGIVAYALGWAREQTYAGYSNEAASWGTYPERLAEFDLWGSVVRAFVAVDPHTGGTAETVGSGGFVLAVIGLCLLLVRVMRVPLLPLAALGAMPLTAYTLHLVAIVAIVGPAGSLSTPVMWVWFTVALLVGATVWSALVGRGPLERLVGWAARRMVGTTAPS